MAERPRATRQAQRNLEKSCVFVMESMDDFEEADEDDLTVLNPMFTRGLHRTSLGGSEVIGMGDMMELDEMMGRLMSQGISPERMCATRLSPGCVTV
jgi:hypothetical protein